MDHIEVINTDGTTSETNCIELPAMSTFTTTTTNESNRLIHQLQEAPDISLDGDSIVFNPNNIDDDIRGNVQIPLAIISTFHTSKLQLSMCTPHIYQLF